MDVELALKQHREYKWSILKTSNNKQKLKQFLDEIIVSFSNKIILHLQKKVLDFRKYPRVLGNYYN